MQQLNLPVCELKIRQHAGQRQIFDVVRKKHVTLTPEEWVRQHFIHYLVNYKHFPASLLSVEAGLKVNQLKKRVDLLAYDRAGMPYLMVECKAPEVKITQDTFDQIARYNLVHKVKYLVVTNGMQHFCCVMDYAKATYIYLETIPDFE